MQTKQQIAISVAQQLSLNLITLKSVGQNLQDLINQYNEESLSAVWAAMATATVNADGSLGAADGSPNVAHPITVGSINKSQTALVAGITAAIQFNNFLNNVGVVQGLYLQNINDLL